MPGTWPIPMVSCNFFLVKLKFALTLVHNIHIFLEEIFSFYNFLYVAKSHLVIGGICFLFES